MAVVILDEVDVAGSGTVHEVALDPSVVVGLSDPAWKPRHLAEEHDDVVGVPGDVAADRLGLGERGERLLGDLVDLALASGKMFGADASVRLGAEVTLAAVQVVG